MDGPSGNGARVSNAYMKSDMLPSLSIDPIGTRIPGTRDLGEKVDGVT